MEQLVKSENFEQSVRMINSFYFISHVIATLESDLNSTEKKISITVGIDFLNYF